MKLKVGMYFRTKNGIINKIISAKNLNERAYLLNGFYVNKDAIKKTGYNIIDILEEGDYVNGCYIQEIKSLKDNVMVCLLDSDYEVLSKITNNEIETIVTKEQMEQMAYKVGE